MIFIAFIFTLGVLVLVHEWGHFITAKRCGVKVEQFAIGFGPKLFSWVHDGTEFCLCAVLLGGFVKMAGDERAACKGTGEEFYSKSAGQRALIILMGPMVNIIFAFFCFWIVFIIGYPDMDLTFQKSLPIIGQVADSSPAQRAGLKLGDQILSVNGAPVAHWPQLQDLISHATGNQLTLTVERDHHQMTIGVNPEEHRIGVGPGPIDKAKDIVFTQYGFFESFFKAGEEIGNITIKTYVSLFQMVTGARSFREMSGMIGIYSYFVMAFTLGFSCLLNFIGIVSASLAIFNLLPIIPLDGGHLLLIGMEKLRGRALSMKTEEYVFKGGIALMIILVLFVNYSDMERKGWISNVVKVFKSTKL